MSRASAPAIVAACVGLVQLVQLILPSPVIAQNESFVRALSEFTAALPGTYGDEGQAARDSLDRLAHGLAEWDQTLREYIEDNIANIRRGFGIEFKLTGDTDEELASSFLQQMLDGGYARKV